MTEYDRNGNMIFTGSAGEDSELIAAKRDALAKLVLAYSAVKELYYMPEMQVEVTPACIIEMHVEINRLRKDLAGA